MSGSVTDPRILHADPLSGVTQYYHHDPDTGGFTIQYQQDVEPILEMAKYLNNNAPLRWGDMAHVADIPRVMMMELYKQGIVSGGMEILDEARFRKWLNDRDNQFMRTRPGKV